MCSDGRSKPLIKGLCETHYWGSRRLSSARRLNEKELNSEPGLPELIEEADIVVSRYVRFAASYDNGIVCCYICGTPIRWQEAQCMHYISRSCYFLRWDIRNLRPGDKACNEHKGGNLVEYAKKLNEEQPGIVDILLEESNITHKPTREEVRQIILEYTTKFKTLQKQRA